MTDPIDDLPPAPTLIYWWLVDADEPLTRKQLSAETTLSKSTTIAGLEELQAHDLVEPDHGHDPDGRKPAYRLTERSTK